MNVEETSSGLAEDEQEIIKATDLQAACHPQGCESKPMGSYFGVFGAPPILGFILVAGLGPIHRGLTDLDFDPWPTSFRGDPLADPS